MSKANAHDNLSRVNDELKRIPRQDHVPALVVVAHSTRAAVIGLAALTEAVLEVADAIRDTDAHKEGPP